MAKRTRAARAAPNRHTLSYQLREIIDARGMSAYAVAQLAELDPGVVSRFMTGTRDIRLGTADHIASALGLRLVEVAKKTRPVRSIRPGGPAAVDSVGDDGGTDVEQLDLVEGNDQGGRSKV